MRKVRDDLNRALFWGYMLDESTDKSVLEEVIVYARFIDTKEGQIKPVTCHTRTYFHLKCINLCKPL